MLVELLGSYQTYFFYMIHYKAFWLKSSKPVRFSNRTCGSFKSVIKWVWTKLNNSVPSEKSQTFHMLKWFWAKLNNTFHGRLFMLCSLSGSCTADH